MGAFWSPPIGAGIRNAYFAVTFRKAGGDCLDYLP